ncbi:MAG: hypothetical protein M0C28_30810 [Candidatus Moduliflexus flocculans]|nr:hypothetical protein [Candidatus Moduliflexus flocculans]
MSRSATPRPPSAGIELIDRDVVQLQATPLRARRVHRSSRVRRGHVSVDQPSPCGPVRGVREGLLAYVTFGPQATGTRERTAGSPRHDAGRGARSGGPVCRRRRLGEHYVPAPAAGDPRASDGPPTRA